MGLLFGLHQLTQVLHLLQHLFPNFAQVMTRLVCKQQKLVWELILQKQQFGHRFHNKPSMKLQDINFKLQIQKKLIQQISFAIFFLKHQIILMKLKLILVGLYQQQKFPLMLLPFRFYGDFLNLQQQTMVAQ